MGSDCSPSVSVYWRSVSFPRSPCLAHDTCPNVLINSAHQFRDQEGLGARSLWVEALCVSVYVCWGAGELQEKLIELMKKSVLANVGNDTP